MSRFYGLTPPPDYGQAKKGGGLTEGNKANEDCVWVYIRTYISLVLIAQE
jgi:hypothetical protein